MRSSLSVRLRTGASVAVLSFALAATAAPVRGQEAPPAEGQPVLEEIIVTGSRIKGVDLSGATQALQITREDIIESGATELIDILRDLGVTSGGTGTFNTSTAGITSGGTPVGASGVSLRGLGTSATLTLINNRRASISSFANGQESFIDVNSIPMAAVERVEVLPSGASALYGADAVAGVVNYVLRRDFEGAEVSVSYGNSTADTDEGKYNATAVLGQRFGAHHIMLVADHFKRNALFDRDRSFTKDSVRPNQQGFYPSFNDLFLMTNDQTEETCPPGQFKTGRLGEYCESDPNDFTSTQDELESTGGLLTYRLDLGETVSWFNEAIYQTSTARGTSSPAFFNRAPVDPEHPGWPAALVADMVEEAGADGFSDFYEFPIFAWGRFLEPRAAEVESETLRLVSGVEVELDGGWSLEGAVTYGRNERTQKGLSGLYRAVPFYNLLLGNICTDGTQVNRWRLNAVRPAASYRGDTCEAAGKTTLWYNVFNGQGEQPDGVAELIETTAERKGESELWSVDGFATGELFELPAGIVRVAIGGEYRTESVKDTPSGDAVATRDVPEPILGFSSTAADAEREQWALFAEAYVPVAPGLELQLAGRYDHYDAFDGDFNPKIAARWELVEEVILRASWSTSFRAPSLAQSGAGTRLTSYTVDCATVPAACGGDATADGNDLFSEEVGNPDLRPEEAESYSAGVLFRPTRDIEVNLDYWAIRHENLVGVDEDDFLRKALAGAFPIVGEGELPTGQPGIEVENGFVTDAHFALTNLGFQETSGIDLAFTQYIDLGDAGDLRLTLDGTYVAEFRRQASPGAPVEDLEGTFRYPKFLGKAGVRWSGDDISVRLTAHYTSSYDDDPSSTVRAALGIPPGEVVTVDSWTTFDLNVTYDVTEWAYLSLSVDNLFDEDPPRALGSGANVDHVNHDSIGRFITLRGTVQF